MPRLGSVVVVLGLLARTAGGQQCPDTPPCGPCVEDPATATCHRKTVKLRSVEVVSTPPGASIHVSKNGKPHKGKVQVTPYKLSFAAKDDVVLTLDLPGYQRWERQLQPGEVRVDAILEYIATLQFDLSQEPAVHGARVWLECASAPGGTWGPCQMGGQSSDCCRTTTYLDSRSTRVVIEREGYDRFIAPLQLGARGATVRPRLAPRAPVREDFERTALATRFGQNSGAYTLAGGKLRATRPMGTPLWMRLGLPADAVIELDASSLAGGDIKLLAWGDRSWSPSAGRKGGGTPGYIFTFAGWNNTRSVLARDNEEAATRVERAASAVAGQRYHFKIVRRGGTIDWYVDDMMTPYLTLTEAAPRAAGTPGFLGLSGWASEVDFDNLVITPLALAKGRVRVVSNVPAGLGPTSGVSGSYGLGTTPWEAELAPGRYSYRIGASGYKEGLVTFDVVAGGAQVVTATLEAAPPPTGRVELRPSVAAALSWRGGSRPASMQHDLDLPPGQYTFTLHHEGWPVQYRDASLTVDVIAGQKVRLGVTLDPAPRVGPDVTVRGGDDDEVVPSPSPTPRPKVKAPSKLDYRVRAAAVDYQRALEARDEVGRASVRNGLLTGMWGVCMMGGIGLGIYGGVSDVELSTQLITLFSGAALAGTCYWRLLRQAFSPGSSSRWRTQQADEKLSKARYGLLAAIDAYNGGRRGSLLSRPAPPRVGFGFSVSDGLVVRDEAGHAGVGIEAGLLLNLGWLHPELAAEVDPSHEVVVARPGVRVSLGRFFFLRGGAETAISGGTDDWALFGGLGVRLPLSRRLSFQLAADFSRTSAETPTSTLRGRSGISYGF
ncbi:MAG: hypothetical protein IT370_28365 [Deltaproteobacteria bacterium]|nr:hypothetical protein [Deltaproteobacteria bacterium]